MLSPYLTDIPINSSQISNIEIDRLRKKKVPKTTMPQSRKARTLSSETQTLNSPRSIKTMYPQRSPQVAFTSTSERFNTYFIEATDPENPGPGTYNFKSTFSTAGKTSFSSKGFGNGFLSKEGRFINDSQLYYEKYKPGPGEYNNNKNSLVNEVKNSLIGKSLYNKKENKSLKNKEVRPDPFSYEPKKINSESYNYESVFKGNDKRFKIKFNSNPGPGTYNSFTENFKSDKGESFMFRQPFNKRVDVLKKLNIKTDKEINEEYIEKKIKNSGLNPISFTGIRQKDFYLTSVDNSLESDTNNEGKSNKKNKKNNINNLGENFDPNKVKQQFQIINIDKKDDLMKLASPRCKINKYEFKVPGPAFYHPPILDNHLSFNRNNKIFLGGTGALFNLLYK